MISLIRDPRAAAVLARLHKENSQQMTKVVWRLLPHLPNLVTGSRLNLTPENEDAYFDDKYLALDPEQAALLYLTARALRARKIVEFGTSFGISTIWLASAVRENGGGKVFGTEYVPEKAKRARANFAEAGVEDLVEILEGDARETLKTLDGEPVDLLLNDGFPDAALDVLKIVAPKMRPGAVILTDNVGPFKPNYASYLEWVRNPENGFQSISLPFRGGTEYSVKM
ncbi:putative O-methyltransferase [Cladochytrium replicatum]|nr:putative O-methyltransferase [Cladochytrium replicatum]